MTPSLKAADTAAILLDIEGTITPIAFVHEMLFPYARERVRQFLSSHHNSTEVMADIATLHREHHADLLQNLEPPSLFEQTREEEIDSITAYVHWLIDRDRKSTGLKSLQGKIWKEGYADGTLKASLFDDVAPALRRWQRANLRIGIFSSGSVLAQQLLLAHTNAGDLTDLIDAYFDTTTGPKTAVESYRNIAAALGIPARSILFVSDVVGELDAAGAAEMQTLLSVRPGNQPPPAQQNHQIVEDFDGL
ncbi:MAG TPA: acireductone synthase [Pyrinomonadaceae bacterium]|nr:acireductone synthase [Pyrinomonadaceae bacterium]